MERMFPSIENSSIIPSLIELIMNCFYWHSSLGTLGFPMHSGKIRNLHKFDAEFFGIPDHHAEYMDPQLRKLLEVSFEAVMDAGELC